MKIVAVLGSPRQNGNSTYIARRFLETAQRLGAETQSFALNVLSYRGCQACRACKKTSEVCILNDDLTEVLDVVREADVIVFASPVYFSDLSGQMKLFLDRMYCFLTPDFHSRSNGTRLLPGKAAVFILTQGLSEDLFADVFPRYQGVMRFIGIHETHLIRGCNLAKPDDVLKHEDMIRQAEALAVHIMNKNAKQD